MFHPPFARRLPSWSRPWLLVCLALASDLRAAVISEFMAANASTLADEDGDFSDWVELFNPQSVVVDLGNWSLTDDASIPRKWELPATNLPSGGRLVVFASGKDRRTPGAPLHTNFKLSSDGEYLALARPDGTIATAFSPTFPPQRRDVSYGLVAGSNTNGFLASPTPGTANVSGVAEFVADTQFSHHRGFYSTGFQLVISCATPNALIYYTVDGSPPSATNGTLYTGPIPISRTTTLRARAEKPGARPSNVDTQTYLFLADIPTQQLDGTPPPGWPATWGDSVVDYGMDPDIVTKSPWSGTISNDLQAVPTLSLVMRLEDLFGAQTGIYSNPSGQGPAWERPCSLELIYPDERTGFQTEAGVRLRGQVGRLLSNPKRSFRFLFREEYGDPKLKFPLFAAQGGAAEFDGFDLRAAQNSWWFPFGDPDGLFIAEPFSRGLLVAMGQPGERGDWYHLYINGQYWGLYNSCERPEASFAATYFGGEPEDYDVLKPDWDFNATMQPTDGNDQAWIRLWESAVQGFAANADYFRVQGRNPDGTLNPAFENLLEVTNLVDYLLSIFWTGNNDGPVYGQISDGVLASGSLNNYFTFRSRRNTSGFRFVTHDAEWTLRDAQDNRIALTTTIGNPLNGEGADRSNPYYLWMRLLQNAEFRQLVADRIQMHFFGNGALTREACTAHFLARKMEIDHAIVGESARWGDVPEPTSPLTRNDWLAAVDNKLANYLPYRTEIVLDQLRAAGLFPALAAPEFAHAAGEVPVGFTLSLGNPSATGAIFYTVDGSDPRAIGGSLSGNAINYTEPIPILTSVLVRARVKNGSSWSPLVEGAFYPAQDYSGLRVTEVMFNPPALGSVGGDEFEFLELMNGGANTIDLGGISFSGITFTFTNGTRLGPGAFFVLARNSAQFGARYPGVAANGVYTGKLDDGGETLTLTTALGFELLKLTYDDAAPWPISPDGHGFSLATAQPASDPTSDDPRHWRASSAVGGSPGAVDPTPTVPRVLINEVLTHTDPPQKDSIELYNPNPSEVNLGGWYLTDEPSAPRKFRIPDGMTIAAGAFLTFTEDDFNPGGTGFALTSTGDEVYLLSGTPGGTNLTGFTHGVRLGAAANGVSFGRYVNSVDEEHFPAQIAVTLGAVNSGPRIGPAVISEIHYHPLTNHDEFVEVLNITGAPLALFDPAHPTNPWRINGLGYSFPLNTTLPAHGLALVVGIDPAAFRAKYGVPPAVAVLGPAGGVLQDSGERLELQKPDPPNLDGTVPYVTVDEVRYNDRAPWPVAADGDGASLQRLTPDAYGNDPLNWFAGDPSPGRVNRVNIPPTVALIAPVDGQEFTLPTTILLEADANDSDGTVTLVEFFDGSVKLGELTNLPHRFAWATATPGTHQLTAQVWDSDSASAVSAPVRITARAPSAGNGFGLRGEYFNDTQLTSGRVARLDPNIDFTWLDQPHPNIRADGFSVRWTGRLQPPLSGTYTFRTLSAGGVRFWLEGTNLIDNWSDHAVTEDSASIALEAGHLYSVRLEFYNTSGVGRVQLAWEAPGLLPEPIRSSQFLPPLNPVNQPPTVTFTSPRNNRGFPPGPLALHVSTADPDGVIYKLRYLANGAPLGESLAAPFSLLWTNPPRGACQLSAVAIDDNLASSTSAPVTVHFVDGQLTNETLIAAGSGWHYWDRGPEPATNWAAILYDDTGWSNGLAELGYGDGDETSTIQFGSDPNNKHLTAYFRHAFTATDPESIASLQLRLLRDDGAAIYLNGEEVFRDNLPAGPLDFTTLALSGLGLPEEDQFLATDLTANPMGTGVNVLAAQVHQFSSSSTDASFDLELIATRSVLAPFILAQPASAVADLGATVSLSVDARGAPPLAYQWRHNGVALQAATNALLILQIRQPTQAGSYTVNVSNPLGNVLSEAAVLAVTGLDTDGDGLPDAWEIANGTQPGVPDAGADPDGDGMTNLGEFLAGTSPTDAASVLRLSVGPGPDGGATVGFTRVGGISYTLLYRARVPDPWLPLTNLAAQALTNVFQFVDPGSTPLRFYQVVTP